MKRKAKKMTSLLLLFAMTFSLLSAQIPDGSVQAGDFESLT